jgi:hypothetical protein
VPKQTTQIPSGPSPILNELPQTAKKPKIEESKQLLNPDAPSYVLSPIFRVALNRRIKLYQRTSDLLHNLQKSHVQIDQEFLAQYELVYMDIRSSTKVLRNSLKDPIWGFEDSVLSEKETREHFKIECLFLLDGLKREMKEVIIAGSF